MRNPPGSKSQVTCTIDPALQENHGGCTRLPAGAHEADFASHGVQQALSHRVVNKCPVLVVTCDRMILSRRGIPTARPCGASGHASPARVAGGV